MKKILLIEDNERFANAVKEYFKGKGLGIDLAFNGSEGIKKAKNERYKIILLDIFLPDMNGLEILPSLSSESDFTIILTSGTEVQLAVKAMKKGAFDFITKPVDLEALYLKISNLLRKLHEEEGKLYEIIGDSPAIRKIKSLIKTVARGEIPVLIVGETGVGKELVARAIHMLSGRRGKFVDINCPSIPENLFESELFGYTRGAFTDALSSKKGLFLEANGGTIFLDEITALPSHLQPKLLRVLETREVRPLGDTKNVKVDVKLVAATNEPSEELEKKLRKDIYYRISALRIEIPPLRDRKEDIIPLTEHFINIYKKEKGIFGITKEVERIFLSYSWPGNVRELKNEIERAVLICKGRFIESHCINEKLVLSGKGELKSLKEVEKEHILKVLSICKGNKSEAAKILGISRMTLRKKLK